MRLTFRNPLAIPAVAMMIKATIADFSFGWSIKLKHPSTPNLWRHFDDALNHLFVSDNPKHIAMRGLPPTRWFAVPELTNDRTFAFCGFVKVPSPNLCASGLTSSMCRPVRCFLQSEMRLRGFNCEIAVVHVGAILNNSKYDRPWEANADGVIVAYLDQLTQHGSHCLTNGHQFTNIVPEAKPVGIDLLFAEGQQ